MISDYGKGCDFYNFTYKLGLRGDGKRANSFVFFSHLNFIFFIFFRFFAHTLCHQSQFTAFMREKIGLIFIFLNFFRELGIFPVLFFHPNSYFSRDIKIIAEVLFYFFSKDI